jgi:hypothetical protein
MSDVSAIDSQSFLKSTSVAPGEIVLGMLTAFDSGSPLVSYMHSGYSQRVAVSAVALSPRDIGRQVALSFVSGDLQKPMVVGLIHGNHGELLDDCALTPTESVVESAAVHTFRVDGKKVVVTGDEEIVLQCGESSITLTKGGKIEIRGKYLVSRSTGVNRILGASVNVN